MSKLTLEQIDEYFEIHLPYRNRILAAHKNICARGPYHGDRGILESCFEASLITGRMYLNVLGIGKVNSRIERPRYHKDDLNAQDLGGNLVNLSTLPQIDKEDFLNFLIMADKGAAHLTKPRAHNWEKTHIVIYKIINYIKTNIYSPANRKCDEF